MSRQIFDDVLHELPQLTANGFVDEQAPDFSALRREFLENDRYHQEMALIAAYLKGLPKSERFSEWQRAHCDPIALKPFIEFRIGEKVSVGSIIAAAVAEGFTMGVREDHRVYFNFSADRIESGLAELRNREQLHKAVLA